MAIDQNSSNGTGGGKSNWRERLGIGSSKEMPRLSDEFESEEAPLRPATPAAARAQQPVSKLAPMAPRGGGKPQVAAAPVRLVPRPVASRANPQVAAVVKPEIEAPRAAPAARLPASDTVVDSLAEKLKAQRAAAERLALQRVAAARERAEGRAVEPSPPPPNPAPKPVAETPPPPRPAAAPQPAARPKFTFADDPGPAPRQEPSIVPEPASGRSAQPPLNAQMPAAKPPVRSVLGEGRLGPSLLRPQPPPSYRPEPPPYRAIDPATGYPAASNRPPLGTGPRTSLAGDAGYVPMRSSPRPAAYDSYRRVAEAPPPPPPPPPDENEPHYDEQRPEPRLGRPTPPVRARARQPEPVAEDIFEDEAPPPKTARRRASVMDYQAAQREADYGGEEEHGRRSMGPWLLLAVVLIAGLLTAAGVWYYTSHIKAAGGHLANGSAATATGNGQSGAIPVVPAPSQPAKTTPETTATGNAQAPAQTKKQIYDRIVGDQEIPGGKVQPTEVVPVQPEAPATAPSQQGAVQLPQPGGAVPAGGQDSGTDTVAPLPLPPPPGDTGGNAGTQGSLTPTGDKTVAEALPSLAGTNGAAQPPEVVPAAAPSSTDASAAQSRQASLPAAQLPSAEISDRVPGAIGEVDPSATASTAATTKPVVMAPTKPTANPAASKAAALKKSASALASKNVLKKKSVSEPAGTQSVQPLILVSPSQAAGTPATAQDSLLSPTQGTTTVEAVAPVQPGPSSTPPATHRKTIFDLFKGRSANTAHTATPSVDSAPDVPQPLLDKKVAALPPVKSAAPAPATASGGSGYVVQLATFASQGEAQSEFGRLRAKYPSVVGGLAPRISQASIGGSTRYQLGLGPVSSHEQATQVCSSLFSSGERDCLVRKQ